MVRDPVWQRSASVAIGKNATFATGCGNAPTEPAAPTVRRFPDDWTDRELLIEVLRQLRGPTLAGWPQLGGRTLVDSVAELRDRS